MHQFLLMLLPASTEPVGFFVILALKQELTEFNVENGHHLLVYWHAVVYWLRHYITSRKVAGSRLDKVTEFFSIYLILPAALGPGVHSASNRNEYQKQRNNVSGE
jgi:hypothetical protein